MHLSLYVKWKIHIFCVCAGKTKIRLINCIESIRLLLNIFSCFVINIKSFYDNMSEIINVICHFTQIHLFNKILKLYKGH